MENPADEALSRGWEFRKDEVVDQIKALRCDVIGLQEVSSNQLAYLQSRLVEPEPKRGWRFYGVGREDGASKGEAVPIFWRNDRFWLVRYGSFWLSELPEIPGSKSWKSACPRLCSWVLLGERGSSRRIAFFNTHLDHKSDWARKESVAAILARVRLVVPVGVPVVLVGDMNCTDDAPAMQALAKMLVSVESVSKTPVRGPVYTFNAWKDDPARVAKIDYIWTRGCVEVSAVEHVVTRKDGRYPSDHFPIVAELKF